MKRTLVLDEDDLIMVVKEDVVKQIDEHRGEMNRTEFVNYLIQCQLRDMSEHRSYVTLEDFQAFALQMTGIIRECLNRENTSGGNGSTSESQGLDSLDRLEILIRSTGESFKA